jgi:hypothetical protein
MTRLVTRLLALQSNEAYFPLGNFLSKGTSRTDNPFYFPIGILAELLVVCLGQS